MKVLTPTQAQFNALNDYQKGSSELLFVKDGKNNWIVGKEVLNDPNFEEIQNELSQLKEINYEPTPEPIK
jgi:hypothetical protein